MRVRQRELLIPNRPVLRTSFDGHEKGEPQGTDVWTAAEDGQIWVDYGTAPEDVHVWAPPQSEPSRVRASSSLNRPDQAPVAAAVASAAEGAARLYVETLGKPSTAAFWPKSAIGVVKGGEAGATSRFVARVPDMPSPPRLGQQPPLTCRGSRVVRLETPSQKSQSARPHRQQADVPAPSDGACASNAQAAPAASSVRSPRKAPPKAPKPEPAEPAVADSQPNNTLTRFRALSLEYEYLLDDDEEESEEEVVHKVPSGYGPLSLRATEQAPRGLSKRRSTVDKELLKSMRTTARLQRGPLWKNNDPDSLDSLLVENARLQKFEQDRADLRRAMRREWTRY